MFFTLYIIELRNIFWRVKKYKNEMNEELEDEFYKTNIGE